MVQYPYLRSDLQNDFPNTSFPDVLDAATLAAFDAAEVVPVAAPAVDLFHTAVEGTPVLVGTDWTATWTVVDATAEEIVERKIALQAAVVAQTQARLDNFARTRNYDGILSATTYAGSSVQKFQIEGQYCLGARDATWATLYTLLAEVEAGTRPVPGSFADVAPDLPVLAWPN